MEGQTVGRRPAGRVVDQLFHSFATGRGRYGALNCGNGRSKPSLVASFRISLEEDSPKRLEDVKPLPSSGMNRGGGAFVGATDAGVGAGLTSLLISCDIASDFSSEGVSGAGDEDKTSGSSSTLTGLGATSSAGSRRETRILSFDLALAARYSCL